MNVNEFIKNHLSESANVKSKMIDACKDNIKEAIDILVNSFENGGKLLLCGNGGSAADTQHIAAEFIIRLSHDLDRPAIPAISLAADTSNLTAGGNDIGFDNIFKRQVEGLGNKGDVLIAISTSGNSENVIRAVNVAHDKGMQVIGFLGKSGGKLLPMVDCGIVVPSESTQHIQEGHIAVAHILCEAVERTMYDK